MLPLPNESDDGALVGEVLWVDRFGNCQLNFDADLLRARDLGPGDGFEVRIGENSGRVRWVDTFADAKPSELVVLVDSYGLLRPRPRPPERRRSPPPAGRHRRHAPARRRHRSRRGGDPMRRGTAVILAALLILILLASLIQFFVQGH